MHMHDGTADWLKMLTTFLFIGVAVWWLNGAIGTNYTVLVIFALVGVILFAGGALFSHMSQRQTLDAITKFNANDAKIDAARMQTFKIMAAGESAMQKAAANLTVLDAKRINQIATQQAKLLTDAERERLRSQQQTADTWTWDDDSSADVAENNHQEWR